MGDLPGWLPADLAVPESAGVACLACRLPPLPLAYFAAPIPPPPFPSGEGGDFLFSYARGFAPCIPGAEPGRHRSRGAYHALAGDLPGWLPADLAAVVPGGGLGGLAPMRHWLSLPRGRGPSQTPPSLATDSSISPGPPSPWLPALSKGKHSHRFCTEPQAPFRRVPVWQGL